MPPIRLYDTAVGRVVEVERQAEQSMYVCGITPYDATHMGHAASYVSFDLLNRAWRDAGVRVSYVQNVTDVDDPLLERATATGVDWRDLAQSQIDLFQTDMDALNVLAPNHYIGAVEAIPDIVPAIEKLIADGVAYRVQGSDGEPDGDVYYDVETAGKRSSATDAWKLGEVSGLGETEMLTLFAERGETPPGQASRTRWTPCCGGSPVTVSPAGREQVSGKQAGMAHRMYRDRAEVPPCAIHSAGWGIGPDFPPPRNGSLPRLFTLRRSAGPPLLPRRHGGSGRRKDEQVKGKPGARFQTPRSR